MPVTRGYVHAPVPAPVAACRMSRDIERLVRERGCASIEDMHQLGWTRAEIDELGEAARALVRRRAEAARPTPAGRRRRAA
ncbi:MAG: hypothetical protein AB7P02_29190 [Alphaproteobacteria bacterium]